MKRSRTRIRVAIAVLSLLFVGIMTYASEQDKHCQCGPQCKCGVANGTGACSCGVGCNCKHNHTMSASENEFLKMMDTMMMSMDSAKLTGNVNVDFLVQMIPHHQGAVEMAKYEIEHGKDFEMIQLAKSILAEQQNEIAIMETMIKNYGTTIGKPSSEYVQAMNATMETMMKNTPTDSLLKDKSVDCAFAMVMLPHHQAAVDMAVALMPFKPDKQTTSYAESIIASQQYEIDQMNEYIKNNCNK